MKSLMQLVSTMLHDMGMACRVSTQRDLKTISLRVEHEGLSFLTITLPTLGKAFERWLEQGFVDDIPSAFRARSGLPIFLSGFLHQVFDRDTRLLLDVPCVHCIRSIRQLTLMFKKILFPCKTSKERKAYAKYIKTDQEVRDLQSELYSSRESGFGFVLGDRRQSTLYSSECEPGRGSVREPRDLELDRDRRRILFKSVAAALWGTRLQEIEVRVASNELLPKHGPGATAERISGNQKYVIRRWHDRLERAGFFFDHFCVPNSRYVLDGLEEVSYLDGLAETPVRVISVPKTLDTPRIIAIEPVCMQYVQQSICEVLVRTLEDNFEGALGFTDQSVSRELARIGSVDGSYATIDLSDASDRVSNLLVYDMLESTPNLLRAVQACRSLRADVPGYGVRTISKFASMGSALCFPIEAMVFLTAVLTGIIEHTTGVVNDRVLTRLLSQVRIYGDDIIVPVGYTRFAISGLEALNLKINMHKSFWNGKFRESCGGDYYDGQWVTPVYVRRNFPDSIRDTPELESLISLRNQLYQAGYWKTVQYLDTKIEALIPFPITHDTSPGLTRRSFLVPQGQRICRNLHRPLVRAATVVHKRTRKNSLDGYHALQKFFLKRGEEPFQEEDHLSYSGRPDSAYTKIGWVSIA